ncbi:MAG: hypothetical protein ACFFC7_25510 [Candidatus Hermodarchaeota archaeon]
MFRQKINLGGRKKSPIDKSRIVVSELEGIGPKTPEFRDIKPGFALFSETIEQMETHVSLYGIISQLQQEIAELKRKNEDLENKIKRIGKYLKEKHEKTIEEALEELEKEK